MGRIWWGLRSPARRHGPHTAEPRASALEPLARSGRCARARDAETARRPAATTRHPRAPLIRLIWGSGALFRGKGVPVLGTLHPVSGNNRKVGLGYANRLERPENLGPGTARWLASSLFLAQNAGNSLFEPLSPALSLAMGNRPRRRVRCCLRAPPSQTSARIEFLNGRLRATFSFRASGKHRGSTNATSYANWNCVDACAWLVVQPIRHPSTEADPSRKRPHSRRVASVRQA